MAVCPIVELGFLRVACANDYTMAGAREVLATFLQTQSPAFVPCDMRALDGTGSPSPRKTTDIYLADLAASRGWRFATLDEGIAHPAADLLPK